MTSPTKPSPRPYHMRKRLEDVDDTRRRIVEAAVELHGTVGPAHTTFSGVAAQAGVQRSTVYRHFTDEEALFGACTSHWFARHPWPRLDDLRSMSDPVARLRRGLAELYRYYETNERMLANAFRDVDVMPRFVGELMRAHVERTHAVLLEVWPPGQDRRLDVALRLGVDFPTWQSLDAQGLTPDESADLMAAMVDCLVA